MSYTPVCVSFHDILPGEQFHLSRGVETGIFEDLERPGTKLYKKLSARRYMLVGGSSTYHIGSIYAMAFKANR